MVEAAAIEALKRKLCQSRDPSHLVAGPRVDEVVALPPLRVVDDLGAVGGIKDWTRTRDLQPWGTAAPLTRARRAS